MVKDYLGNELSEGDRVVFIDIHYPIEFSKGVIERIESGGWAEVSYKDTVIGVRRTEVVRATRMIKCD